MMSRKRDYIPLPERLAAALSMLLTQEERDALREVKASASKVIALFNFDHVALHALGGSDAWHNLTPMLIAPHRQKSRRDTSIVAKVKRIAPEHEEFRRNLLKPKDRITRERSNWPKGRKLQSRNDFQRRD